MRQADMALLFEYNYWANRRILVSAARISQAQFTAETAFPRGSLRGTLVHILDAEYGWRELLDHGVEMLDLQPADFPSVEALTPKWREEEAAMRKYLGSLTDANMPDIMRYTNPQGIKRERVLWHGLFHVVNHGTQHRSECAAMLTDFGQSPGDIDFTLFLSENPQLTA